MLVVSVQLSEDQFDERTNEFVDDSFELKLEHSLLSMSKWESKFCKPFLGNDKTTEETLWYVNAMALNSEVPEGILQKLSSDNINSINTYINAPMTATTVNELPDRRPSRQIITNELVYSWMIDLGIPFSCEQWHLNRLLMLIKVRNAQNAPSKKMSKSEMRQRHRELNLQRRQAAASKD